jgi:predicted lipoprotein with Yx(FWY)xxD motif
MKRIYLLLAGVLIAAVSGSAVASAHAARATQVVLRHTSIGSILMTSSGFTLYEFTHDHGATNSCLRIHECPQVWPALESAGAPVAGSGVRGSLLSSIRIAGGARQVTYAGHPLYRYSGDGRGTTGYVGINAFGGNWYALNASGHAVR